MLKGVVPRRVRPGDASTDIIADGPSDDNELMGKYEERAGNLMDVRSVEFRKGGAKLHPLMEDHHQDHTDGVAMWTAGKRCPYVPCRVPAWNPQGVKVLAM